MGEMERDVFITHGMPIINKEYPLVIKVSEQSVLDEFKARRAYHCGCKDFTPNK